VEFHLAGSPLLLEIAQELCVREGARVAEAGEFTRRAYLNGRLDLTRAEAVLAMIRARDDEERRAALALLEGGLERRLAVIRDRVLRALVPLELALDFSDQDVEILSGADMAPDMERSARELEDLASGAQEAGVQRSCFRVALQGPANAGKSSLFNRLLGEDVSLVTRIAGTTRDALTGEMEVGGVRIELVDTAGDGVTNTLADMRAHEVRRRQLREADLILEVRDLRNAAVAPDPGRPGRLRVWTHADQVPGELGTGDLVVSNLTGVGVDEVRREIGRWLGESVAGVGPLLITGRQASALRAAADAVRRARGGFAREDGLELVASDLRDALHHLRVLTGESASDDVLDRIFSEFCIGK